MPSRVTRSRSCSSPGCLSSGGRGQFPVEALVSTFAAAELNDAMRAMKPGHVVKPVVVFDEGR